MRVVVDFVRALKEGRERESALRYALQTVKAELSQAKKDLLDLQKVEVALRTQLTRAGGVPCAESRLLAEDVQIQQEQRNAALRDEALSEGTGGLDGDDTMDAEAKKAMMEEVTGIFREIRLFAESQNSALGLRQRIEEVERKMGISENLETVVPVTNFPVEGTVAPEAAETSTRVAPPAVEDTSMEPSAAAVVAAATATGVAAAAIVANRDSAEGEVPVETTPETTVEAPIADIGVETTVDEAVIDVTRSTVETTVDGATVDEATVDEAVIDATGTTVETTVDEAMIDATGTTVETTVDEAMIDATGTTIDTTVDEAVIDVTGTTAENTVDESIKEVTEVADGAPTDATREVTTTTEVTEESVALTTEIADAAEVVMETPALPEGGLTAPDVSTDIALGGEAIAVSSEDVPTPLEAIDGPEMEKVDGIAVPEESLVGGTTEEVSMPVAEASPPAGEVAVVSDTNGMPEVTTEQGGATAAAIVGGAAALAAGAGAVAFTKSDAVEETIVADTSAVMDSVMPTSDAPVEGIESRATVAPEAPTVPEASADLEVPTVADTPVDSPLKMSEKPLKKTSSKKKVTKGVAAGAAAASATASKKKKETTESVKKVKSNSTSDLKKTKSKSKEIADATAGATVGAAMAAAVDPDETVKPEETGKTDAEMPTSSTKKLKKKSTSMPRNVSQTTSSSTPRLTKTLSTPKVKAVAQEGAPDGEAVPEEKPRRNFFALLRSRFLATPEQQAALASRRAAARKEAEEAKAKAKEVNRTSTEKKSKSTKKMATVKTEQKDAKGKAPVVVSTAAETVPTVAPDMSQQLEEAMPPSEMSAPQAVAAPKGTPTNPDVPSMVAVE